MISGAYPEMKCGIGDYTARLAEHLARRGVEIDVLTCDDPAVNCTSRDGVRVFPALCRAAAANALRIRRHVRRRECGLIHLQYPTWPFRRSLSIALLPAALRAEGLGPLVLTLHEVARCHPLNRLRLIPAAYAATAVVATTEEDRRWLGARLPGISRRTEQIPIGPNIEPHSDPRFDRLAYRRRLGIADDEVAVCHFGFALKNKRIEDLLAALRMIACRAKVKLLLMTGFEHTESGYADAIRKLIRHLRLERFIIETGFLPPDEASHCLAASDFAALLFRDGASFRRGSMLAAMAHGLPVISCRAGRPASGLRDGENILLCDGGDVDALASMMLRLCREPDLRRRLAGGSIYTARRFAWAGIAERTAALYARLCG